MAAEIEIKLTALRSRLQFLRRMAPSAGWSVNMVAQWMADIGQVNLEIAELLLVAAPGSPVVTSNEAEG